MTTPVRIFIGCDPNDCDLEQLLVLHYGLLKHSSLPLDITLIHLSRNTDSFWFSNPSGREGWNSARWPTPFSGLRWGIPAFCGGAGRAIYVDPDIMVFCDIAELWTMPLPPGKAMLASRGGKQLRLGILLWDCQEAIRWLPPIHKIRRDPKVHERLKQFFDARPELVQPLAINYSNIDGDGLPLQDLKLLHYSDMGTQFSHRYALPRLRKEGKAHWFDGPILTHPRQDLADLFDRTYREALDAGFSLETYRIVEKFGTVPKKEETRYKGNSTTRGIVPALEPLEKI